jgi:hypothetical protein
MTLSTFPTFLTFLALCAVLRAGDPWAGLEIPPYPRSELAAVAAAAIVLAGEAWAASRRARRRGLGQAARVRIRARDGIRRHLPERRGHVLLDFCTAASGTRPALARRVRHNKPTDWVEGRPDAGPGTISVSDMVVRAGNKPQA